MLLCLTASAWVWVTLSVTLQHHLFFPSSAYQNNDITEFEKILKTNHSNIMDDPFIREHIEGEWWMWFLVHPSEGSDSSSRTCDCVVVVVAELLRNIRTQVLIKLIKPYTRIHIPFISKVRSYMQNMSGIWNLSLVEFCLSSACFSGTQHWRVWCGEFAGAVHLG